MKRHEKNWEMIENMEQEDRRIQLIRILREERHDVKDKLQGKTAQHTLHIVHFFFLFISHLAKHDNVTRVSERVRRGARWYRLNSVANQSFLPLFAG